MIQESISWLLSLTYVVGSCIGGGFRHTSELKAMSSGESEEWKKEVVNEKARFDKYNVFAAVKRSELPVDAKILSKTWAMKKKTNGILRAMLNARGYEQEDGVHYFSDSISSPVTNPGCSYTHRLYTSCNESGLDSYRHGCGRCISARTDLQQRGTPWFIGNTTYSYKTCKVKS
jgi:hypothetical protein